MTVSEIFRPAFEAAMEAGPAGLRKLRHAAYDRFLAMGLPSTHDERWKHTSLAPLARTSFGPAPADAKVTLDDLKPLTFGTLGRLRAVFVDGRLVPSLSSLDELPDGVEIESCVSLAPEADRPRMGSREAEDLRGVAEMQDALNALNLALASDGALVGVPAGQVVEEPLYLYFYATNGPGAAPVVAVRNMVFAGARSQLKLVEAYGGAPGARNFTSVVAGVTLHDGAVLDHVKLQRESPSAFHVARLDVTQSRGSRFSDHSVNLGAALHRHDINVLFKGQGSECSLDGLFMASGEQHTDTHTLIDHARPHCTSRELYKGILDGKARGVFHGRIVVRKDAQKTDAIQTNKNLLLSREALVNSVPQLEILADDVKCKHGSTTGQLDAAALFYLRSRGLGEAAARSLLTYAFASDLVQRIPVDDVRSGLEAYLQVRLPVAAGLEEAVA